MFKWLFAENTPPVDLPSLRLFNSESRQLEDFVPRKKYEVTMYSCGPTVYDYAHIGNLRAFVLADLLKRTLLYNGYHVRHTMNFTDFGQLTSDADTGEDKMMKGLRREGMEISLKAMRELSDRYIEAFKDDVAALNILEPTDFTRASDYVKEQINLIKTLEEKGYTYETNDGLYFDISKFATYGRLGSIDLEQLQSGARVEVNPEKRHPADFALWKKSELGWESKWGRGFPGWHIECSAMAMATLGKTIDIHTGGIDLAPTHHNAEIAQSECATGKQFVRYWLHNAFLNIDEEKISKSLGNTLNLRDLQERGYSGTDYRYWLLTAHYRSPINFTFEALDGSRQALLRLKRFMYEECTDSCGTIADSYRRHFIEAINDDLDSPKAIAVMWELLKDDSIDAKDKRATILEFDSVLGVGLDLPLEEGARELGYVEHSDVPDEIWELVDKREAARIARNWDEADKLREALKIKGYTVEDTPDGPRIAKEL